MNNKLLRSRHFSLALPIVFASALGGCASQNPAAQNVQTRTAQTQPAQVQPVEVQPRLVVQKPMVRQVYKSAVAALTFSSDSKTLASAGNNVKNSDNPRAPAPQLKVEMLDASTLRTQKTLPLLPAADFVVFSPGLKRIVIISTAFQGLQLIDAANGKSLWQQYTQHPDYPPLPNGGDSMQYFFQLAFSPGGDKVLTGFTFGRFQEGGKEWWSVDKKKLRREPYIEEPDNSHVPGLDDEVLCYRMAFSPDSKTYVIGSRENTLALVDTKTNKMIWAQEKYYKEEKFVKGDGNRVIQTILFSPDGKTIATGHADNSVCLWNAQNSQLLRTIKAHSKAVQIVAFSPDSTILASGSDDGAIVLSSTRNGATLGVLPNRNAVTALTFAPDGNHLAAGYADGKIAVWRMR